MFKHSLNFMHISDHTARVFAFWKVWCSSLELIVVPKINLAALYPSKEDCFILSKTFQKQDKKKKLPFKTRQSRFCQVYFLPIFSRQGWAKAWCGIRREQVSFFTLDWMIKKTTQNWSGQSSLSPQSTMKDWQNK